MTAWPQQSAGRSERDCGRFRLAAAQRQWDSPVSGNLLRADQLHGTDNKRNEKTIAENVRCSLRPVPRNNQATVENVVPWLLQMEQFCTLCPCEQRFGLEMAAGELFRSSLCFEGPFCGTAIAVFGPYALADIGEIFIEGSLKRMK